MINSANTVDFGLDKSGNVEEILPRSETVPSNQLNAPTYVSKIPQGNAARVFLNYGATPLIKYAYPTDTARAAKYISKTKDVVQSQVNNNNNNNNNNSTNNNKERVRVQHLQTHEKLQNNRWNYHTLYNISAEMERDIPNNNHNNNNNYKFQNESAFEDQNPADGFAGTDFRNNISSTRTQAGRVIPSDLRTGDSTNSGGGVGNGECVPNRRMVSSVHRTEDQENAFRRIEDVHNYAKLKRYSYSNGDSSNSSIRDDVDDEEEDDDDDDEDEVEENEEVDDEDVLGHDIIDNCDDAANYSRYFSNLQSQRLAEKVKRSGGGGGAGIVEPTRVVYGAAVEETESDAHVDVETVPREPYELSVEIPIAVTPAHHARRPMNAFLIFCKRHRAIVKDRYKSLENRAITKILGDWWASLDVNDKKCFTNLAQLNKDAFFSANPNFKWCKLPAPPLRTLSTRPSNAASERAHDQEPPEDDYATASLQVLRKTDKSGNYFKLADEAQMGELSTLLMHRSGAAATTDSNNKTTITSQPSALQQALGETTQFLSTHMPALTVAADAAKDIKRLGESTGKRRLHSRDNAGGNSFSSNSNSNSEDDIVVPPKKSARSCKGKIYQELINSGQIAAIAKKSPSSTPSTKVAKNAQSSLNAGVTQQNELLLDFLRRQEGAVTAATATATVDVHPSADCSSGRAATKRHASESLDDLVAFDLEDRIKGLPALNLDAYLQRKRNTKKKKKFTAKKRNSNSASSTKSSSNSASTTVSAVAAAAAGAAKIVAGSPTITPPPKELCREPPAVGSQKRKARKESITRRDVNAIENEVAAALLSATDFTTINGCYYFNETPVTTSVVPALAIAPATPTTAAIGHASPISLTNTINNNNNNSTTVAGAAVAATSAFDRRISSVVLSNFSENISSTSDLLILAEVAANRTELTN